MRTPRSLATAWTRRKRDIDLAHKRVAAATERKRSFALAHMKRHPLSPKVKAAILARVKGGGAICCVEGRRWLNGKVDAVWAELLNAWAYEALTCKGDNPADVSKVDRMLSHGLSREHT